MIDENQFTGLCYFYSTIAQSTAALIALFGVFAIFRIQYSNIQKEGALKSLRDYIKLKCFDSMNKKLFGYDYVDSDVQCWLDKDVPAHLREIILKGNTENKEKLPGFIDFYLFINSIENFTQDLIKYLIRNMWIMSLLLIFNVFALQGLTNGWMFWDNSFIIWFTILFLAFALWKVIEYAQMSINGPDFIILNNNETNKQDSGSFSKQEIGNIIKNFMVIKKQEKEFIDIFKARI